ncbi:uncharacterized protein LOC113959131 [Corapipo altera]|uniref:uncharacterized protein LOC113959131 n=1 Tax=Corapipo altera TaxID=415028 RepID=UPI000FD68A0F|nr:uncharacterized protein LOC113959131 [Corapipo altera]
MELFIPLNCRLWQNCWAPCPGRRQRRELSARTEPRHWRILVSHHRNRSRSRAQDSMGQRARSCVWVDSLQICRMLLPSLCTDHARVAHADGQCWRAQATAAAPCCSHADCGCHGVTAGHVSSRKGALACPSPWSRLGTAEGSRSHQSSSWLTLSCWCTGRLGSICLGHLLGGEDQGRWDPCPAEGHRVPAVPRAMALCWPAGGSRGAVVPVETERRDGWRLPGREGRSCQLRESCPESGAKS